MKRIQIFQNCRSIFLMRSGHFFTVYKDLEGKKTAVNEFDGALGAVQVIEECIDRYKKKYGAQAAEPAGEETAQES